MFLNRAKLFIKRSYIRLCGSSNNNNNGFTMIAFKGTFPTNPEDEA